MEVLNQIAGARDWRLMRALLFWCSGNNWRATLHPVIEGEYGPGTCPTVDEVANLCRQLLETSQVRDVPPAHILFADGSRVMWYRPAHRAPVFCHTGRKEFDAELRNQQALYPNLLFLAKPGQLSLWALAGSERPDGGTPVYRAPVYNVYENGKLCTGTTKLPSQVGLDVAPWEKAFYETTFTHSNVGSKLTAFPGGHDALWRELIRPERTTFDSGWLLPLQGKGGKTAMTVREVLNG